MRGVPPPNDGSYARLTGGCAGSGGGGVPPPIGGSYARLAGVPPRDDGAQLVGGRAGGGRRPAFMEGLPPRYGGGCGSKRVLSNEVMVSDDDSWGMRKRRSSSSPQSSFSIKDDAGYIGYLTDDDESGSGDEGEGDVRSVVDRRRRELMGSDISFSSCMFMMITVCGLLMLFLFAASPWGVPPPRRL